MGWLVRGITVSPWLLAAALSCSGRSRSLSAEGGEPTAQGGEAGTGGSRAGRGGRGGGAGTSAGGATGGSGGEAEGGAAGGPNGGAAGGDSAGAGAGGTAGGPTSGVCTNPWPYGHDLEGCDGDFVHRTAAGECALPVRDGELPDLPPDAGEEDIVRCEMYYYRCTFAGGCKRDDDCGPNAYCVRTETEYLEEDQYLSLRIGHACITPCSTSTDCPSGAFCACESREQNASRRGIHLGACREDACRDDAACGPGSLCIAPLNPLRLGESRYLEFHCQTPRDDCHGPERCPNDSDSDCCPKPYCEFATDRFVCDIRDTCDDC